MYLADVITHCVYIKFSYTFFCIIEQFKFTQDILLMIWKMQVFATSSGTPLCLMYAGWPWIVNSYINQGDDWVGNIKVYIYYLLQDFTHII